MPIKVLRSGEPRVRVHEGIIAGTGTDVDIVFSEPRALRRDAMVLSLATINARLGGLGLE